MRLKFGNEKNTVIASDQRERGNPDPEASIVIWIASVTAFPRNDVEEKTP